MNTADIIKNKVTIDSVVKVLGAVGVAGFGLYSLTQVAGFSIEPDTKRMLGGAVLVSSLFPVVMVGNDFKRIAKGIQSKAMRSIPFLKPNDRQVFIDNMQELEVVCNDITKNDVLIIKDGDVFLTRKGSDLHLEAQKNGIVISYVKDSKGGSVCSEKLVGIQYYNGLCVDVHDDFSHIIAHENSSDYFNRGYSVCM